MEFFDIIPEGRIQKEFNVIEKKNDPNKKQERGEVYYVNNRYIE